MRSDLLDEIWAYLPKLVILRLSHLCRKMHQLEAELNPWIHAVGRPIPWWSFDRGSRIAVHGNIAGTQHVTCSDVLITSGPAGGRLGVVVACADRRIVISCLHLRKVVVEAGALCRLHCNRIANPHGDGVVCNQAWCSLRHSTIDCLGIGVQANHSSVSMSHSQLSSGSGLGRRLAGPDVQQRAALLRRVRRGWPVGAAEQPRQQPGAGQLRGAAGGEPGGGRGHAERPLPGAAQ